MWEALMQIQSLLSEQMKLERFGISSASKMELEQYEQQNARIDALLDRLQKKQSPKKPI